MKEEKKWQCATLVSYSWPLCTTYLLRIQEYRYEAVPTNWSIDVNNNKSVFSFHRASFSQSTNWQSTGDVVLVHWKMTNDLCENFITFTIYKIDLLEIIFAFRECLTFNFCCHRLHRIPLVRSSPFAREIPSDRRITMNMKGKQRKFHLRRQHFPSKIIFWELRSTCFIIRIDKMKQIQYQLNVLRTPGNETCHATPTCFISPKYIIIFAIAAVPTTHVIDWLIFTPVTISICAKYTFNAETMGKDIGVFNTQ